MKPIKNLFALLLSLLLLAGCKPTPKEDVIINKGDGELQEKIAAAPVEETFEAPTHLTLDEISGQHTKITVDADVVMPETKQLPVAEIVGETITIEWVRRVMEAIADGREIRTANTEIPDTKPEIVEEIRAVQNAIEEWETEFKDTTDPAEWQERYDDLRQQMEAWQEAYRSAPDEIGSAADLSEAAFRAQGRLYVSIDFGKKFPAVLEVYQYGTVNFSNWDPEVGHQVYFDVPDGAALNGVAMSKEDAVKTAQDFMARLGETGYEPAVVRAATLEPRVDGERPPRETWTNGWYVVMTRPVNGVPAPYYNSQQDDFGYYTTAERVQYIAPLGDEYAEFWIRDSGVNEFHWYNPSVPVRTVNESVALAPFDKVIETFRKQAAIEIYPSAEEYKEYGTVLIKIDRIELGMSRVRKENAPETYLLVPMWFFYGATTVTDLNEKASSLRYSFRLCEAPDGLSYYQEEPALCFMRINAIDGSRIDPQLGY